MVNVLEVDAGLVPNTRAIGKSNFRFVSSLISISLFTLLPTQSKLLQKFATGPTHSANIHLLNQFIHCPSLI